MRYSLFSVFFLLSLPVLRAQPPADYWQQRVEYQIDVRLDDQTHAVQGRVKLKYFNNSPDTMRRVFFHLYWNAIQPNSAYARWARQTSDPLTPKKLFELQPGEIGKQDIFSVQQNGNAVSFRVNETILEVELNRPLMPNDYAVFDIAWQGQVPLALKRAGRDNASGVAYSFAQWYPKICAYDRYGWHADPYIGREFYGEFGSFKVNITLPKKYVVAATGVLQNGNAIGFGYEDPGAKPPPNYGFVNVWKFQGDNIHDFAWAADPEFVHEKVKVRSDLTFHYFYQPAPGTTTAFKSLQQFVAANLAYVESQYGKYLYPQFSFVQGGEGAMEYPMLTLIDQNERDTVMTPVAVHEWLHNWYYGMIGNNENDWPWLDEGFASYAASDILGQARPAEARTLRRAAYDAVEQHQARVPDPMSTPANLNDGTNTYAFNAYPKGEVFLWQLRHLAGDEAFRRGMLRYHRDWQFKHPTGDDFFRTMERASGLELDWYYRGWTQTLKQIDYGVENIGADGSAATRITLKNYGTLPMPLDVVVEFADGTAERHYIPLDLQYGSKPFSDGKTSVHEPWSFSVDTYEFRVEKPLSDLKAVTVDPEGWLADVKRGNNRKSIK